MNSVENSVIISYEHSEPTSSTLSIQTNSLRQFFESDLNLEEHFIEVHGVPIHTGEIVYVFTLLFVHSYRYFSLAVKRTFIINNVTPINCMCGIEVINFNSVELEANKYDEVLVQMGHTKSGCLISK